MSPTPFQLRVLARELVHALPADLVRDLAELERRGQLGCVLDRVFGRVFLKRAAVTATAAALRGELAALFPVAERTRARTETTIALGALNVARTAAEF